MHKLKKTFSLLMALALVLSLGITAYAAEQKGSITIHEAGGVSVEGKTFLAYKVLDLNLVGEGYVYTVPEALKDFYADYFELNEALGDFDYQVTQKIAALTGDDLFAFASGVLAAAKEANIAPASVTGQRGDTSVKFTDLPLGYYVVEDTAETTPVSALVLTSTKPNVEVNIKAELPVVDKKIIEEQDRVETNNAAVGDVVSYEVTSKVPDMTGYTKYYFVLKDTMSLGLTFNQDVAITIGNQALTKDTDFTVTAKATANGTEIEIVFKNFISYKDQKGDAITVTYSATINENAVIGAAGNPNYVKLQYSNNPNKVVSGDPDNPDKPAVPEGETPEEEVRTYVTGLKLIKVDPEGNRLTGAEFTITGNKLNKVLVRKDVYTQDENGTYWRLTDGTYTTQDPLDEGVEQSKYESVTVKYVKESVTEVKETQENVEATAVVGDDGVLRFDGLSAGDYEITELRSPAGYNLLEKPFKITIDWTAPENVSGPCTWTVSDTEAGDGYASSLESGAQIVDGCIQIQVENKSGTQLPETGGMGTTLFYIVGGLLMTTAVVLLITKKKLSM